MDGGTRAQSADWLIGAGRHDESLERIYAAAVELMVESGTIEIGADEIAERAGCSRATLYRHAGGKSQIRDAVLGRSAVAIAQKVAADVADAEEGDRVVSALIAAVSGVRGDRLLYAMLPKVTIQMMRDFLGSFSDESQYATASGLEFDDLSAAAFFRVVISLVVTPANGAAAERDIVKRFVRGIGETGPAVQERG